MKIELKTVECKNCHSLNVGLNIYMNPKELHITCENCGLSQTVLEYTKDATQFDLKEIEKGCFSETKI